MKSKKLRQEEAKKRNLQYNSLTIPQKIVKIDSVLGEGKGAIKERGKLLELLSSQAVESAVNNNNLDLSKKIKKKNYQKPKKS